MFQQAAFQNKSRKLHIAQKPAQKFSLSTPGKAKDWFDIAGEAVYRLQTLQSDTLESVGRTKIKK